MTNTPPILGFEGEYRFLSNFAGPGFLYRNVYYQTNEHFYQAWKTNVVDEFMEIINAPTPGKAKKLGRQCTVRLDWDTIKDEIMLIGLQAKFSTAVANINDLAAQMLLDTGDAYLEETNTWGDTYWGVCDGVGQNKLGKALMIVREGLSR